jgi:hypothetical protein
MKIGILTICTGKYTMFFDNLYQSCENHFLKEHDKTYYAFTDGDIPYYNNVVKINQPKLGWPYDTMMRFHMFNTIRDLLLENDYVFFFNANMMVVTDITDIVIPLVDNDYLMGVLHPSFYNLPINYATYDRNNQSSFYIPYNEGKHYYQGCFNGGRTIEFLEMCNILSNRIDIDLKNNIIPLWHDESALNWYYKDKNPLTLSSSYAYPEMWNLPMDMYIAQIDKDNYGGHKFLRN